MEAQALAYIAAGFGAALVTFSAGWSISKLATSAMQGMSRQPEASSEIRGAMIITAAMVEGVALLSAVICFLLAIK